jgi:hypothetical protein
MTERTCDIDGCTARHVARGWCSKHYQKWKQYGDPLHVERLPRACKVEDCRAPAHGHEMCKRHYLRWYKHGDPLTFQRSECAVDGCETAPRSAVNDFCEKHYIRQHRHGDPDVVIDTRRDDARYRSAHSRLTRSLGSASQRPCVDCGSPAHHWSYKHTDPNALMSPTGQPYSLNSEHYEPRCAACHRAFDTRLGAQ